MQVVTLTLRALPGVDLCLFSKRAANSFPEKVCVNVTCQPLQAFVMKPVECYRQDKYPNCEFHRYVMTDSDPC